MTVRDMIFRGQGALGVGVRVFLFDALNDDKNDFHRFERLQISGCTWAGLVLEGRNAKNLCLYHVVIVSTASGIYSKYGVLTLANFCPGDPGFNENLTLAAPIYNHGASFIWSGGGASGCATSNILLGDHNDSILVQGIYSEKSGRWLHVPEYPAGVPGGSKAFPVTLDSCRYGTAGANPNLPADGKLVIFQADGPLTIRGCSLGDRIVGEQLRIDVESRIKPGTFIFQGNSISNDGDGNVFVVEAPSNPDYPVTNRGYRAGQLARLGASIGITTTLSTVVLDEGVDTPAVNTDTIAERRSGGGITLLGQNIKAIQSFTAAVDLPSLGADATALVAITATGVKTGDRLIFHPNRNGPGPGAPTTTADLVIGLPWISADDQISFIVHNPTGSSIDSLNHTWHGLVFRP